MKRVKISSKKISTHHMSQMKVIKSRNKLNKILLEEKLRIRLNNKTAII